MRKIFLTFSIMLFALAANASRYIPEFDKMETLRCDVSETVYNQDGSVVTKNNYHRLYRLDDESNLLYIQKEPVNNLLKYDKTAFHYKEQSMTDDFIMYSDILVSRTDNEYKAESRIVYDNIDYPPRYAKAQGQCKIIN